MRLISPITGLLLLACASTAAAEDDVYRDPWLAPDTGKQERWEEGDVPTPATPRESNLLALDIDNHQYRYFIDRRSLSVGASDDVARYTVVIESPAGARNVLYEGVRCHKRLYRTYAYGSGEGAFNRVARSPWRAVQLEGVFKYRSELAEYYLCDGSRPIRDKAEVVRRIKDPADAYNAERFD